MPADKIGPTIQSEFQTIIKQQEKALIGAYIIYGVPAVLIFLCAYLLNLIFG